MHFHIENMACGGCVRSITKAIQSVDPTADVRADTATHNVDVVTTAPRAKLESVLADVGFSTT